MKLADLILNLFHGRPDVIAHETESGFAPHKCPDGISAEWIETRHLAGAKCLGFYLMTEGSQVFCSCVDFDNKPDDPDPLWQSKTEAVYFELCRCGVVPLVELSQSGNGSHVWIFFHEPVDAYIPREFWRLLGKKLDLKFKEIFPKQDRLNDGGLGNLVRFPLWNQSRFVDVEDEWATVEPEKALRGAAYLSAGDLRLIALQTGLGSIEDRRGSEPKSDSARDDNRAIADSLLVCVQCLKLLNPSRVDAYDDWLQVGMILHSISPTETMLQLWDQWSAKSKKYTAGACGAKWRSFHADRSETLSLGSLVKWAKEDAGEDAFTLHVKSMLQTVERKEKKSYEFSTFKTASIQYVERLASHKEIYISSGIRELDQSIDGVAPGEVAVIAARPGHGKTAIGLQWLGNAAKHGYPALIVSEEMSALEIGKRRCMSICPSWGTRDFHIMKQELECYHEGMAEVYIVENCHTIERVEEVIDKFCEAYGVKIFAVDYLQLLTSRKDNLYEIVTEASKRIKQTAKRNNAAGLVLSQLNREIEKRKDYEPKLSDLRESGQIEQDADLILFGLWPCRMSDGIPENEYRLFAAKRRNGPIRQPRILSKFRPEKQIIGMEAWA